MQQKTEIKVALSEDGKTATIRVSTQSKPIVCGVLAIEQDEVGKRTLYLDRRIHQRYWAGYQGWQAWGAVSTILEETT